MRKAPRRLLIAVVLVVAAALAAAAVTSASSTVRLKASSSALKFNVKTLRATHGRVTLVMSNPSSTRHGIAVEGHGVDKDGKIVGKGHASRVTVTLRKGSYVFYCPVPGHRAAGMKGKLIVS